MTFADDPLAEAILLELRGIRAALEKTATAYTKMAKLAEERSGGTPAPAKEGDGGEKKKREPRDPKDILTVTGYVLHFNQVTNAANGEPKLTKGGKPYWSLKLTNGFEAMIFSTTQATTCSKAYDEQKPLIVDYVKDGKYNNVEAVKIGAATAEAPREPGEDDDDDSPF